MLILNDNSPHSSHDMVEYTCSVCGYRGEIRYNHYKQGVGCSACLGKTVVHGINDIATTAPEVALLFANPDDAFSVTRRSHRKVQFRCPDCGAITERRVADVTARGFRCASCSPTISFPNRVMKAVLDLLGVDYVREANFEWSLGKRYDFYLENLSIIIEMHGRQHYDGFTGSSFCDLIDIQNNDKLKRNLAVTHGVKHYVVIDASKSSVEYISSHIMSSDLARLIDLSGIRWDEVSKLTDMGIYWDVVMYYNASMFTGDIQRATMLDQETIRRILRLAAKNGDCDYTPRKSLLETQAYAALCRKKKVICITTGEVFDSVNAASERYGIKPKTLSASLNRHKTTSANIGNAGVKLHWDYYKE